MAMEIIGATLIGEALAGSSAVFAPVLAESMIGLGSLAGAEALTMPLIGEYFGGLASLLGEGAPAVVGAAETGLGTAAASEAIAPAVTQAATQSAAPIAGTTAEADLATQIQQGLTAPQQVFGPDHPYMQGRMFADASTSSGAPVTIPDAVPPPASLPSITPDAAVPKYPAVPEVSLAPPSYPMPPSGGGYPMPPSTLPPGAVPASSNIAPVKELGFFDDPLKWMDKNKFQTAVGGLGIAKAMGAFNPKTGLNNLPPQPYQRVNTSYNPGTVNPNYGQPGQPYFVSQGYGPMTRETFYRAAGGGIRALSEGGYIPNPRGQMRWNEKTPKSLGDSAAFVEYLKSNINKDEEKGQAGIDANVSSWLERHAKSDIKGMAEGGLSNLPSAYQQPQYQMSDFANSPLFQPTGGNAPVQPGISEYIANLNQRSYTPPAVVAAPAVTDTTSPTIYDPVTQRYSTNPNLAVPVVVEDSQDGSFGYQSGSDNSDKAGGPIKSKKYAMGGLAALPEYAAGGQLLSGDGDGMSDSIPAVIKGARPQRAALADGEFVIPADVVSHLGNGSTKAGGKRLYEMMANIRKARTGNSKQGKQINPMKFIPA